MARLEQIMAQFGGLALGRLDAGTRAQLADAGGTRGEMRAAAFALLPEADRVALVKAAGAVPPDCGEAIPVAPARGAVGVFDILGSYPKGADGSELKPAGHMGRKTMQCLDVFGRMAAQSRRRGGDGGLTASQVSAGRMYRTLIEDRDAGAVRCISAEAMAMGGAGGGTREGFTDHRLDLSRRIDAMHARLGSRVAVKVRRGGRGVAVTERVLVDMVCLSDAEVSDVLAAHGWSIRAEHIAQATAALGLALDRMWGVTARVPRRVV